MAEEVAQDVFLVAHRALAEQRYRGQGTLSTWLFGIARNLCSKVCRDTYRQTKPLGLRRLEHELTRLERQEPDLVYVQVWRLRYGQERLRADLQQRIREAAHGEPPRSPEAPDLAEEALAVIRYSMQRLAGQDRQTYMLLYMHVYKGLSVRELAGLQGVSRSAVARSLTRAKATLRTVYQAALIAQAPDAPAGVHSAPPGVTVRLRQGGRKGVHNRRPGKNAEAAGQLP
jgi:RNA polymerase sigma factor (sigma-70 family)